MLSFFKRIINSVGHCINEVFSLLDPKLYCTKKKKVHLLMLSRMKWEIS